MPGGAGLKLALCTGKPKKALARHPPTTTSLTSKPFAALCSGAAAFERVSVSMVDSQDVNEGPSWADIWELRRARRRARERGLRRRPPKEREAEGGYSYDEVSDEIRLVIADTARLLAEDPSSGIGAL